MKRPGSILTFVLWGLGSGLLAGGALGKTFAPWIDAHALFALLFFGIYLLGLGSFARRQFLTGKALFSQSAAFNLLLGLGMILFVMLTQSLKPGFLQWLRAILLWPGFVLMLQGFRLGVIKASHLKPMGKNLGTLALGLLFIFLALETVFMFRPMTIGSARNLSSRLWFAWYWEPINSLGYRDEEPAAQANKRVVFLGDSFTAGQGIERVQDRFPDLYRKATGHEVNVLAHCGADTRMELGYLQSFPESLKVEEVLLGWYVNDLEGTARDFGYEYEPKLGFWDGKAPQFVIESSYLLSYVYGIWPRSGDFGYADYLESIWSDAEVLAAHRAEILRVRDEASRRGASFRVLLFPLLQKPELSRDLLAEMHNFLEGKGIPAEDLTELSLAVPAAARMVSPWDAHPGEAWHRRVADRLGR